MTYTSLFGGVLLLMYDESNLFALTIAVLMDLAIGDILERSLIHYLVLYERVNL